MIRITWLGLELLLVLMTVPDPDVLQFVVDPFLASSVEPVWIVASLISTVIWLQVVPKVIPIDMPLDVGSYM